jgi:hypothetical protein
VFDLSFPARPLKFNIRQVSIDRKICAISVELPLCYILRTAVPRIAMANETFKMAFIITEKSYYKFQEKFCFAHGSNG